MVVTLRSEKPLVEAPIRKSKEGKPNKGNHDNLIIIQDKEGSIEAEELLKKPPHV